MGDKVVAVYGAAGHTGKFVARELEGRGCGVVRIGRRAGGDASRPGAEGAWRCASCDDALGIDRALEGVDAVINCAGPFADTAFAIVEAALRRRVHYFDVCAEQRTTKLVLAGYSDDARSAGVVVLPAMAFYGGLADLLASAAWDRRSPIERIDVGVALDSWHPTAGTRRTGERNTARRVVVADGVFKPLANPAPTGMWRFAAPFGPQRVVAVTLSEIVTLAHHLPARGICSYMNLAPLHDLHDPATPEPEAVDTSGRSAQQFQLEVALTTATGAARNVARGRDIYAASAPLVVEACMRVLGTRILVGGTYAAGQLFDVPDFLASLAPHVAVERIDEPSSPLETSP